MVSTSRIGRTVAAVATVGGLLLGLAACGRDAVPAGDIEQEINKLATQRLGAPADAVDCPQPLPAKIGSSIRCSVTVGGGQTYGVTIKISSIDGDHTEYNIEVDEAPSV